MAAKDKHCQLLRIRGGAPRLCAIQIHVYFTYFTYLLST